MPANDQPRTDFRRHPNMTQELVCIIAACRATQQAGSPLAVPQLVETAATALATPSDIAHRDAVTPALAAASDGKITTGELAAVWETCAVPAGTSVEEVIGAATRSGIDAARLHSACVRFEASRHIPLIWHQANKLAASFPDRTPEDLFGWGWQGLLTALRAYDPAKGFAFSTYACTRISGTMRDGIRSEDPVPKRLLTLARKASRAEEALTQQLGRAPALAEVAAHMDVDLARLEILPRLKAAASVEERTEQAYAVGRTPAWAIDSQDPADLIIDGALRDDIEAALALLDDDAAVAVRLLILEERSVAEARAQTGITTRQLRQHKDRGLAALADHLAEWAPAAA